MTLKRAISWLAWFVPTVAIIHFGPQALGGYFAGWVACLVWVWAEMANERIQGYRTALRHVEYELIVKPGCDVRAVVRELDEEAKKEL